MQNKIGLDHILNIIDNISNSKDRGTAFERFALYYLQKRNSLAKCDFAEQQKHKIELTDLTLVTSALSLNINTPPN